QRCPPLPSRARLPQDEGAYVGDFTERLPYNRDGWPLLPCVGRNRSAFATCCSPLAITAPCPSLQLPTCFSESVGEGSAGIRRCPCHDPGHMASGLEIGRASCRERA